MNYPPHDQTVEVLVEVARRIGKRDSGIRHPVDIASAMSFAIEYGGETLAVLMEKEIL